MAADDGIDMYLYAVCGCVRYSYCETEQTKFKNFCYYYDCRVRLICDLARFPAGLAVQFPVRYLRCANNYYCLFINA